MTVTDNKDMSRYEMESDGEVVFANYHLEGETLQIKYVEAPPSLRGTGAAGKLMQGVMELAEKKNYKVFPICGYAVSWINRHSEYHHLRA